MAVFKIRNAESLMSAVEFIPVSDGNFAFFTAKNPQSKASLEKLITSPEINQQIVGEAHVDGHPVIITRGNKTQGEMVQLLQALGDKPELVQHHKSVDTWKVISMLAVPGQLLQLTSSLMRKNNKVDWGLFAFAASNLVGHAITWQYGAQKSEDTNRLHVAKEQVNHNLAADLPAGESLPNVNDTRKEHHSGANSISQRANNYLKGHSVYVGEIMCRYLGAFALAFPINQWGAASKASSIGEAYKRGANPQALAHSVGLASIAGKTTAMFAKTEDPYDPEPKSSYGNFREKTAFRLGGWIEAGAFSALTYDALTNPQRRITFQGKEYRDYVGAAGSALFTARYIVRNWAKFGEKNIDMDELYAHTSDSLAKMPADKLPTLLASTASEITKHFKDKELNYGEVYTRLMTDLYRYHHIALDNTGKARPLDTPRTRPFAKESLKPTASFAQSVNPSPSTSLGIGA